MKHLKIDVGESKNMVHFQGICVKTIDQLTRAFKFIF